MAKVLTVVRIPLGLKGLDPAACFERLAGPGRSLMQTADRRDQAPFASRSDENGA